MSDVSGHTTRQTSAPVYERDYLERTIATVRNHRGADNCWPQWANIFADEIERLWERESELDALAARVTCIPGCCGCFAEAVLVSGADSTEGERG